MADHLFTSSSDGLENDEHEWRDSRRAGMVALVLILFVEFTTWSFSDYLIEEFQLIQRLKKRHYTQSELVSEIPIIGDSSGMHISPAAVAKGLGLEDENLVYNYNWPYYGVEAHPAFLRQYLPRLTNPPKFIILSYPTMNLSAREDVIRLDFVPIWFTRSKLCLPRRSVWGILTRHPTYLHLFQQDAIETITPATITYKDWILHRLRALVRTGTFEYNDPNNVEFMRQWEENRSLSLYLDSTYNMAWMIEDHQRANGPERADFNPMAIERFEEILAIAADYGSQVIVVPSPVCATHAEIYKQRGILEAFEAFALEIESRHPHLHFLMKRAPVYPDDHFGDIVHVNRRGSERHNREVSELLHEYLASQQR